MKPTIPRTLTEAEVHAEVEAMRQQRRDDRRDAAFLRDLLDPEKPTLAEAVSVGPVGDAYGPDMVREIVAALRQALIDLRSDNSGEGEAS